VSAPATVLVTAAGSAPAQAFIRAMRAQRELPVRLVGVDTTARSAGLFDCERRYTVPRADDPGFLAAIGAICDAERVDVLAPIGNFELQRFADAAEQLTDEHGVRVLTSSAAAVRLALDKRASSEAAARQGVAVPALYDGSAPPLPVVVKPNTGTGSEGMSRVREPGELAGALARAGARPLVQQLIEGPEYTVDMVVAPDGEVLAAAPRIRVEVRAGQSYKALTVDDPEVEAAARRCAQAIGISAQANVQLIRSTHDGRCYFLECNPKFAAAMGLTIGAGLNVPLLQVKLALGLPVAAAELRRTPGMWLLRSWHDRVVPAVEVEGVPSWNAAPVDQPAGAHDIPTGTPRLR
jgi:carbamoyl-phosphate synthase large subunit